MPADYAKALYRLKVKGELSDAVLVQNLTLHLKRTGKMKLLPAIVRELQKISHRKENTTVLEIAHESERATSITAAQMQGVAHSEVRVNESLIRGWRAKSKEVLIDRSGKKFLIDLYRAVTQ